MTLEVKYQEAKIQDVMDWFAENYKPKPETFDWFYDAGKEKVVFKLFVKHLSNPDCDCGICDLCIGADDVFENTQVGELTSELNVAKGENKKLRDALARINANYREAGGLPLHLQAYCMRSEAKVALGLQSEENWQEELSHIKQTALAE